MRTLAIGDLHGNLRGLLQALELCNYDPANDEIITIGDYVDGWMHSYEVVSKLIELDKEATYKQINLKGNHDVWCDEWLRTGIANVNWAGDKHVGGEVHGNGGQSTLHSYDNHSHMLDTDEHRKFFRNLHNYYVDDSNRLFIHAGYTSIDGVGHEDEYNYVWDRKLFSIARSGTSSKSMPKILRPYEEVFIGHTSTTNFYGRDSKIITEPIHACNLWNIDTGAGFDGKLTIIDVDTKEYWQSDLCSELYSKEDFNRTQTRR